MVLWLKGSVRNDVKFYGFSFDNEIIYLDTSG